MKKVRWGVLSTANIGLDQVIPAMQQGELTEMVGIASRNGDKAKQAAEQLGMPKWYDSYEALLEDPDIDAIYNPLPNDMHVPWTIKAMEAGKHVLCEKPIGMDTKDAQKLLDATEKYPDIKVMEAFMYRFHPQWDKIKQLIADGAIGEVKTIRGYFSYFNNDPEDIRNQPQHGGGGLLDIGVYCIQIARYVYEREPERVFGTVDYDPNFKTDRHASGILDFGDATSTFTCSTQIYRTQRAYIMGTDGEIVVPRPYNPVSDGEASFTLNRLDRSEEYTFAPCNQYTLQGDRFSEAILNDTEVPTPLTDALNNMKVVDAIFESGDKDRWIEL